MKRALWVAALILLLMWGQGCVVICMDEAGPCEPAGIGPNEVAVAEAGVASLSTVTWY